MIARVLVLVAITACRSKDKPAPAPAPAPVADAAAKAEVHAQLLGCAPALPLPVDPRELRTPRRGPTRMVHEWTPYALLPVVADEAVSKPVVAAVTDDMKDRIAAVDKCFTDAVGTVRAMLSIDINGDAEVRAGGLGDASIERCVAAALAGRRSPPPQFTVELACDFARGRTDAPLRVSPDAGYAIVDASAHEVRVDGATHALPKQPITALGVKTTVLVIADPDATPDALDFALWWAPPSTTLVAVKAAGGAPVVLGIGDSRAERVKSAKRIVQLLTDNGRMHACIANAEVGTAPLLDFRAMDDAMRAVKKACADQPCEPTIVVGTRGGFVAKDLVATTSAARRAGFTMISIGGSACD